MEVSLDSGIAADDSTFMETSADQGLGQSANDAAGQASGDVEHVPSTETEIPHAIKAELDELRKQRDKAIHEAKKLRHQAARTRVETKADPPAAASDVDDDLRAKLDSVSKLQARLKRQEKEAARAQRSEVVKMAEGHPQHIRDVVSKLAPSDAKAFLASLPQRTPGTPPPTASGTGTGSATYYDLRKQGLTAEEIETRYPEAFKKAMQRPGGSTSLSRIKKRSY